jgi:hypothetical protein
MAPTDVSETFSISPAEVVTTANTWQQQGGVVNGLDFAAMTGVSGEGSRTFGAVKTCDAAAKKATESIGLRLTTLGDNLRIFTVTSVENDHTAAEGFSNLIPR